MACFSLKENWLIDRLKYGGILMQNTRGVAILLFAILLQLCSSGMELLALGVGGVGLVAALTDNRKSKDKS